MPSDGNDSDKRLQLVALCLNIIAQIGRKADTKNLSVKEKHAEKVSFRSQNTGAKNLSTSVKSLSYNGRMGV